MEEKSTDGDWSTFREKLVNSKSKNKRGEEGIGGRYAVFDVAYDAFSHYHASANPPLVRQGHTYFAFTQGPVQFFLMDTRRYRSDITKTEPASRTMLGDKQLSALYDWLGRVSDSLSLRVQARTCADSDCDPFSGQQHSNVQIHCVIRAIYLSLAA